jgi:hypothetical protein
MTRTGTIGSFFNRLCGSLAAAILCAAIQCAPAGAQGKAGPQGSDSRIKAAIQTLRSPVASDRVPAASFLVENWHRALDDMIAELRALDRGKPDSAPSESELASLIPLTDVLRSIVLNQTGAVQAFREQDDERSIRTLIWASRSPNRNLRLNATYVLASVADNTNLCMVLDHLRDRNLNPDGRVNLLQVAITVAPYAYEENVTHVVNAVADLRKLTAGTKENLAMTTQLLGDLEARAKDSINAKSKLPASLPGCNDYAPVFARPG